MKIDLSMKRTRPTKKMASIFIAIFAVALQPLTMIPVPNAAAAPVTIAEYGFNGPTKDDWGGTGPAFSHDNINDGSGNGAAEWTGVTDSPQAGSHHARYKVPASNSGTAIPFILVSVDATGYENLQATFYTQRKNLEAGDFLRAVAGTDVSTNLVDVAGATGDADNDTVWVQQTINFHSAANDSSSAYISFGRDGDFATNDEIWLDSLVITGEAISTVAGTFNGSGANYQQKPNYDGINIDVRYKDVSGLTGLSVAVNRTNGGPVVKTAKPSLLATINGEAGAAKSKTAPIIVTPGTYTDTGSSSWNAPVGAVWDVTTVPTNVVLTMTFSDSSTVTETLTISEASATYADIAPETPPTAVTNSTTGEVFDTLQEAIDDADTLNGHTLVVNENLSLDSDVDVTKEVVIDGTGKTLTADFVKTDNSNNSALSVLADNVTVRNLTVDGVNPGTNQLHGVNVFEATGVTVEQVTARNFRSGIAYNGASGTIQNVHTENNIWHGINIDRAGAVVSVLGTNTHSESFADIYVDDDTIVPLAVTAPGYTWTRSGIPGRDNDRVYRLDLGPDPAGENHLNIRAFKFNNRNGDRDQDTGEERLEGWTLRLYKESTGGDWALIDERTTDATGGVQFTRQNDAGMYYVCEVAQLGWTQVRQDWAGTNYDVKTDNASPSVSEEGPYCAPINYPDTSDRSSVKNIGNTENDPDGTHHLNMMGYVFNNFNGDRDRDTGEEVLSDWTVRVYKENASGDWQYIAEGATRASDNVYAIMMTDATAGVYHACLVNKSGWTQIRQDWSGTPYNLNTANQSGASDEGSWCSTVNFDDSRDHSNAKYFGVQDSAAPSANAGSDQTTTSSSTVLSGASDDSTATFAWTQVSGPATATFGSPSAATTSVSYPAGVYGTYVFLLTVTDPARNTSFDDVEVKYSALFTGDDDEDSDPVPLTEVQTLQNIASPFALSNTGTDQGLVLATEPTDTEGQGEDDSSVTTTEEDGEGDVLAATDEDNGCYKIIGICWYWWIPIVIAILAVIWLYVATRRRGEDELPFGEQPPRRQ